MGQGRPLRRQGRPLVAGPPLRLSALGACLLAAPCGLTADVLQDQLTPTGEPYYFFVAHHKTGTALINHICDHMQRAVENITSDELDLCARCTEILNASDEGAWCKRWWSNGTVKILRHVLFPPSTRFFVNLPMQDVLNKTGGHFRAVHVARDPLTTFASAYIYDSKQDVDTHGLGGEELRRLAMREGLRIKAGNVKSLSEEILDDYRIAQADPRILSVRFEDFQSEFDATVTKIFDFLMGGSHKDKLPYFLALANNDNQAKWNDERMDQHHVSDRTEKKKVLAALRQLCAEGDKEVAAALRPRTALGYGEECPGPEDEARPEDGEAACRAEGGDAACRPDSQEDSKPAP
mmetsp:Transcript_98666/g.307395  ORF Transcript_98666/g.307395 Transcript_98666/m.307395 type:complete len:350 (+) Transcript_98666:56-1105(+)|eukprot:CAMPEP_0204531996 /NCGR_PEP_ID=MMETSP0661-20131031/11481_1 /ASSEMBLY_ACC=CAM_ASM_000606 /TAXON_ID=109239 /ORGANISM="Alexandrium margalefi, Strain AMGDE01CS-322" /LENGTH=349 /DNA_ID=CAMNT_0051538195 /DNA_START=50 /DNA_END=1099 /DNA_ORIENTATION=+